MTWRVIVRMSFTGRGSHASLRNRVAKHLVACGLKESVAVGTWEGQAVSAAEVAKQFATVFDLLSNPTQIGVTQLEQLWIYID